MSVLSAMLCSSASTIRPTLSPLSLSCCCRRWLTSSEVSIALRPFYFLVHPDLFGRFPDERAVNERSLMTLRAYVDKMVADKQRPPGAKVKFYLKPKSSSPSTGQLCRAGLKTVDITLDASGVREVVTNILKEVRLPTSFVDSIPHKDGDRLTDEASGMAPTPHPQHYDDLYKMFRDDSRPATDTRIPLGRWLADNVSTARERIEKAAPVALRTERVQDEICHEFGVKEIRWDCDWNKEHRLATLNSFRNLVLYHLEDVLPVVRGRSVVFGRYSGVSLEGDIVLFSGEVRSNWLNVIKRAPNAAPTLRAIPFVEKSLSQSLRGIRVVRRHNQPITLVDDYRARLRRLLTTIGDYRSVSRFPEDWPKSMSEFRMCVETESSPLMLSPEGVFIVPANCPSFLLTSFFSENLDEARSMTLAARTARREERDLTSKCQSELGLIELGRADGVDAASMIECCVRLLQRAHGLRHLTHGNSLMVTQYYAVLADGMVCIPWDWVEDDGDERSAGG